MTSNTIPFVLGKLGEIRKTLPSHQTEGLSFGLKTFKYCPVRVVVAYELGGDISSNSIHNADKCLVALLKKGDLTEFTRSIQQLKACRNGFSRSSQ